MAGRTVAVFLLVALAVALVVLVALAAFMGGEEIARRAAAWAASSGAAWGAGAAMLAIYALCLAVPFMPGVEIGLAILAMGGAGAALGVWGASVAALATAFGVGRLVPLGRVARIASRCRLRRAARWLETLAPLNEEERRTLLARALPQGLARHALRHRYLALAVLFNLPGNAVLGGGGGIALLAGASGLVRPPAFLAVAALATAPVPLAVLAWEPLRTALA